MASFALEGDAALRKALKDLEANLRRKVLAPAMAKAMEPVLRAAHDHAPRDTGNLNFHINLDVIGADSATPKVEVGVEGVPYAGVEEYGAVHEAHIGEHFLLKTFDEQGPNALRAAEGLIRDGIEREVRP